MKIITDLPEHLVSNIRDLVYDGKYSSISKFLLIAAENQLTLELSGEDKLIDFQELGETESLMNRFLLNNISSPTNNYEVLESDPQVQYEHEWDSWLWGQINRILPIKFATRFLSVMAAEYESLPTLEIYKEKVGKAARNFGKRLNIQDDKLKTARDQKLSTGFPISKNSEKSCNRYLSQFVGYQKNDGTKTGALFELKLANLLRNDKGEIKIGLTSEGVEFAKIKNPVIDSNNYNSSLGKEEKLFYLDHILGNVPGESSLIKLILSLIDEGINRRDEMNSEIAKFVKGSGWTDGLISTQRSGAISRMYELGLISKRREGLEVRYQITSAGKNLLKKVTRSI